MCIDCWKQQIDTARTSSPIEFSLALLYSVAFYFVVVVWISESKALFRSLFFSKKKNSFRPVHFGFRVHICCCCCFSFSFYFFTSSNFAMFYWIMRWEFKFSPYLFVLPKNNFFFILRSRSVFTRLPKWHMKCAMACRHIAFFSSVRLFLAFP